MSTLTPPARILILTSANHPYANIILRTLLKESAFAKKELWILEQDCLIPKKSTYASLRTYIKSAGLRYVVIQALKQYMFLCIKTYRAWRNDKKSMYYPYQAYLPSTAKKERVHSIETPTCIKRIADWKPDLILSVLSKEILRTTILSIPRLGTVNVHPSYLPNYRGVSPTFWCLANGEKKAGATLHYVDEHIDTGNIILQKEWPIDNVRTEHDLYLQAAKESASLLQTFLHSIQVGDEIKTMQPDKKNGGYFSLPTKAAVREFYARGMKFFTLHEFLY